MKLALFGGSFDPPHAGHVGVVDEALKTLAIDRLIVVPAARNPFKPTVRASGAVRYGWLKKIFASYEKVEISDFEISQDRSVYTIETVRHYAPMCDELYLIIGADNLESLEEWHSFNELDAAVRWVVATRGEISVPDRMIVLKVDVPVSSTDFRTRFSPLGLECGIENDIITYYKELNEFKN
jgi:nicotinate-nucleotide adenylyltransferase